MTHLKIFLLLIVCALSVLDGKAQTGIALTDELNGKRIGVIGDSYVRNHKEPFENTWHYKFAKKALLNTACSGKFTSDRTIQEYVDDIWHLDKVIVRKK